MLFLPVIIVAEVSCEKIIIVNTASYDRVSYALSLAAAAAALGEKVCMFFAHGGIVRLRRGFEDNVGEETDRWMRDIVRQGLEKRSIPRISEQLRIFRKLGGKIYACPAAMALHSLTREDLIEELDGIYGLTTLLGNAKGANIIYI